MTESFIPQVEYATVSVDPVMTFIHHLRIFCKSYILSTQILIELVLLAMTKSNFIYKVVEINKKGFFCNQMVKYLQG